MNTTDIHHTAVAWFLAKTMNGSIPDQIQGGYLDGLLYYSVVIGETELWLTPNGCFTPPTNQLPNDD